MRNLLKVIIISLFPLCASAQAPAIVTSTTLFCTGTPVTFSAAATATDLTYFWSVVPSKGLASFTDLNSPSITLTFTGATTYTIYLNTTDPAGLKHTAAKTISPGRSAHASFNARLNSVGYPTQLILSNYSANNLGNLWSFSDNTTDSSLNVIKEYYQGGNYSVKLFVAGAKGCNDSTTYDFRISDSSGITLPNIFTPNGDGINDVFIPITRGISSLNAWVFNRAGVIVASWDKPKSGWDGHSTSGEECLEGVYIVVVEAMGFDGKSYKLKGTITLVR